jgi:hypothetical protein
VIPPTKVNPPRMDRFSPITFSIPWTGNGVNTSYRVYPACCTCLAAL